MIIGLRSAFGTLWRRTVVQHHSCQGADIPWKYVYHPGACPESLMQLAAVGQHRQPGSVSNSRWRHLDGFTIPRSNIPHASKGYVRRRAVRRVGAARRHTIPVTVGAMAEIRAALHHPRCSRRWPRWIRATGGAVKARMKPVRTPLPRIAGNRVESVPI